MRNNLLPVFIILLFIGACTSDDLPIEFGDGIIESQSSIVIVDTFSVKLSSFKIDSISTLGASHVLVGKYPNKQVGDVHCDSYFQINLSDFSELDEDEVYDSLTVLLNYTGLYYGDTLQPQTIYVHRVTQDIEEGEDDEQIYNTSSFSYDENYLGKMEFVAKPNLYDDVEIRLDDSFGEELFQKMKDDADELSSTDDFISYFKGLVLVPGEENTSVLSFQTNLQLNMVMYTHRIEEEKVELTYNFPADSTLLYFNHIESERTGTPTELLETQEIEFSSTQMDDKSFIQAGTGIVTRIDFPTINRVLEIEMKNVLYRAELVLQPYPNTYDLETLPSSIVLYNTDKDNNLISELTTDQGSSTVATFYYDEMYNENTLYSFDITNYIFDELYDGYVEPENGLAVAFSSTQFINSLDYLVFDARNISASRPKLKLYYLFYE